MPEEALGRQIMGFWEKVDVGEVSRAAPRELERGEAKGATTAFDPRTEISADARFLWNQIFIWFWVVPVVVGFWRGSLQK